MFYNEFCGVKLSALGLGTLRFPVIDDDNGKIDEAATEKIFDLAMESGINYYDTAFGYHGGNSEIVTGKNLRRFPRDSYYIATKFPGFSEENVINHKEIFARQLEKTGMEYFDFYLFHNLYSRNAPWYMDDEKYGLYSFLVEKKKAGIIKHLGVSCHCDYDTLKAFLDKYGENIEFVQIQLNWLDWDLQDAKKKVELLNERGIAIWVMEPVRGGRLAHLDEDDEKLLKSLRPDESIPAWSFRFLQGVKGVTMVLSGMSNLEQVQDNLKTFSERKPLTEKETETLFGIAKKMLSAVPCTACKYCTDGCPVGLDIPSLITAYNRMDFQGLWGVKNLPEDKKPSNCIGCKACEAVCPQSIKISEVLAKLAGKLNEE